MASIRALWCRLLATWRRGADDERLGEELALHMDLETERLTRQGVPPDLARREAQRRLGSRGAIEEGWRDERRLPWLDMFRQDAHYALRQLWRDPRFSFLAISTLAVGIGMTTAIFGLLWGVVLSPLPYPFPERLVRVYQSSEEFPAFPVSPYSYLAYARESRALEGLAVYTGQDLQLADGDQPERLAAQLVSASYFRVLGVQPIVGRVFAEADEREHSDVVVISEALWRRRFGADPAIAGRRVRMSGRTFTVLGVLPAGFEHVGGAYRTTPQGETVDAWWPIPLDKARERASWHYLNAVGRLRRGATAAQAAEELDRIERSLKLEAMGGTSWRQRVLPLSDDVVGTSRDGVMLLVSAVGLLMVIACANVSSLLLARATARGRERAVRFALGASRGRLARQALTEAAVLLVPAVLAGAAIAWAGTRALHVLLPPDFPRLHNVRVDGVVLLFSIAVSALAVIVFGLVPTWRGADQPGSGALHDGGPRSSAGRGTTRVRQALVVAEIALASTLLVVGGLLAQSFVRLQQAAPGFTPTRAVSAVVALPEARYDKREDVGRFYESLLREVRALPNVTAAGVGTDIPWTGYDENTGFTVAGAKNELAEPSARFHAASAGYFTSVGMALETGRVMDERDTADAPKVVVVNRAFARKYLAGGPVVDRVVEFWDTKAAIVGVVGDVKDQPADAEAVPAFWWPIAQNPMRAVTLVVRTATDDPLVIEPDLRQVLARLDAQLPLAEVRTLESIAGNANAQRRFLLAMTLLFAVVALALAALGAYGVLSWTVRQRTRELGIRMALGADRRSVLRLVVGQGLRLAAVGLVVGLALALASGQVVARLLYGMSPRDAVTFLAAALVMLAISAVATLGPAVTATRTSPVEALRTD
jgi:predicted permease